MADWTRLKRGWTIGRGTASAFGIEFWRTKNLDFNDVSADTLLGDPQLPQPGDPHTDPGMKGAMCVKSEVVKGPEGKSATVMVTFSAVNPYSGGPKAAADFSGDPVPFPIPRVRDDSTVLKGKVARFVTSMTIQRARCVRCQVRQTVGDEAKAAQLNSQILPNYGRTYKFSDGDYLFHSHRLLWIQTGQITISYRFWRWAPIQGFPAEPAKWPFDTPPLGTLDEYADFTGMDLYADDFKIPVLLGKDRYIEGDPLP